MTDEAPEKTQAKKRSGQPWRKIRMDDDTWTKFGDLVGDRDRSDVVRSLVRFLLEHETLDLSGISEEQILDFFVRVRIGKAAGKTTHRVQVINIHNAKGPGVEDASQRIVESVKGSFEEKPAEAPAKRARKAPK